MDTRRLVLFVIFSMSILMLWDAWQTKNAPPASTPIATVDGVPSADVPAASAIDTPVDTGYTLKSGQNIAVTTDLYNLNINTVGGDLRKLELRKHRANDSSANYLLLDDEIGRASCRERVYVLV